MANQRAYLHTLMRGLVTRHYPGKQNCAAREIAEYWEGRSLEDREVDYGGFSRKMNGSRAWDIFDLYALMALTGDRRVLQALGEIPEGNVPPSIPRAVLAARAAKESGEAVAAAIGSGDPALIAKEAGEAEAGFRDLRIATEAELGREGRK